MRYMLMFYADEADWGALAEGARQEAIERISAWYRQQASSGHIITGHRLAGSRTATSVRLGRAGRRGIPVVTDGPFVETKEALGSFAIVEVPDHAAAVAMAESWPGGGGVEIRPLAD
ncbi:MAG TPA: YciI family protein [Ktedonobacterales bacterium]|jgi:hypothetical protein|nr:YciI family protein [Ktedonobacterales bacterium]